jgi:hypothetical protein
VDRFAKLTSEAQLLNLKLKVETIHPGVPKIATFFTQKFVTLQNEINTCHAKTNSRVSAYRFAGPIDFYVQLQNL